MGKMVFLSVYICVHLWFQWIGFYKGSNVTRAGYPVLGALSVGESWFFYFTSIQHGLEAHVTGSVFGSSIQCSTANSCAVGFETGSDEAVVKLGDVQRAAHGAVLGAVSGGLLSRCRMVNRSTSADRLLRGVPLRARLGVGSGGCVSSINCLKIPSLVCLLRHHVKLVFWKDLLCVLVFPRK